jgi:hypothetical protein
MTTIRQSGNGTLMAHGLELAMAVKAFVLVGATGFEPVTPRL